jgi:hypothetical protein
MNTRLLTTLLSALVLVSCSVSKNKLVKMRTSTISDFSIASLNGYYKNDNNFYIETIDTLRGGPPTLWNVLYACKTLKEDTALICSNCLVSLQFDGSRKLTVILVDNEKAVRQIELKAKVYKNNLAIKRRLFLVPIPLFFYVRHERKVLLANNSDKSLNVGYSKIDEGQIIFGARDNYLYTLYFPKEKK